MPKSVRETIKNLLVEHGLLDQEANAVMEKLIADSSRDPLVGHCFCISRQHDDCALAVGETERGRIHRRELSGALGEAAVRRR